ncbi:MAG: hypothetical protein GY714_06810 [Desulfobacterales bacterium]|nr:hypothetical protein [Desulfobacterales bacterium]MCP4159944.1 hypothetical protein [Deltaproteobacteria bacterium]
MFLIVYKQQMKKDGTIERITIVREIRKYFNGQKIDKDKVISLSRSFGELDGEIVYLYTKTFTEIRHTLTSSQMENAI